MKSQEQYVPSALQRWLLIACRGHYNSQDCSIAHQTAAARHSAMRRALLVGFHQPMDSEALDSLAADFYKEELGIRGIEVVSKSAESLAELE